MRSLSALQWAQKVMVIDSGSNDSTLQICSKYANVEVLQNPFINFAQQCNFALQQDIKTEWVLSMDADYIVTQELLEELSHLTPKSELDAYSTGFTYLIDGVPLSRSLYPARVCLYRHAVAEYEQDGHAHRVRIDGKVGSLKAKLQHDDRKPYQRWLSAQKSYAQQEAKKLRELGWARLAWADRFRLIGVAPIIIWPYTFIAKGVFRDGSAGRNYCRQRFIAEWLLFKELFTKNN